MVFLCTARRRQHKVCALPWRSPFNLSRRDTSVAIPSSLCRVRLSVCTWYLARWDGTPPSRHGWQDELRARRDPGDAAGASWHAHGLQRRGEQAQGVGVEPEFLKAKHVRVCGAQRLKQLVEAAHVVLARVALVRPVTGLWSRPCSDGELRRVSGGAHAVAVRPPAGPSRTLCGCSMAPVG